MLGLVWITGLSALQAIQTLGLARRCRHGCQSQVAVVAIGRCLCKAWVPGSRIIMESPAKPGWMPSICVKTMVFYDDLARPPSRHTLPLFLASPGEDFR